MASTVNIVDLRTSDDSGLVATGIAAPNLSWRLTTLASAVRQVGYEAEVSASPGFDGELQRSGFVVGSSLTQRPWPAAPLRSRELRFVRVRAHTNLGLTSWSSPLRIEAGLLQQKDWMARPIRSSNENAGEAVTLFRREVTLDGEVEKARLYVTARGVYRIWVNGVCISDDELGPGWTAYDERLFYAAYDVTSIVKPGSNALCAMVGEGWYSRAANLEWLCKRYGSANELLVQLEVEMTDSRRLCFLTDGSWRAGHGEVISASLFNGSQVDLGRRATGWLRTGFDDGHWSHVVTTDLPRGLQMRSFAPVRIIRTWSCTPARTARGTLLVDCQQNLTGVLRLRVRGPQGARVTVRHAEVLNEDGTLHREALRSADCTDSYTLGADEAADLQPVFTYHGFRYAEIETSSDVVVEEVEVLVMASDLLPTGEFECSDERLNRLFQNIVWSQRGNFLAVPTDCPQRDERLGWSGDIQVFAQTACIIADTRAFLASWLEDLSLEQAADGRVSSVVPNTAPGASWEFGRAGWADAATRVPWALYEAYGDETVLRRQYSSMQRWVNWCVSRLDSDGTWVKDTQFGDWLDPNAPVGAPEKATTDSGYIASCCLAHSARIVSRVAAILHEDARADHFASLGTSVAAAAWKKWRLDALRTQTGCAMALELDIAPDDERAEVAEALAQLIQKADGRIGTGFLGTPLVLPALTSMGQDRAAFRLLLNEHCPGWLYTVLRGATTIWERWNAIDVNGAIHRGDIDGFAPGMLSFNHYAFGAIGGWLFRSLAGISPTPLDPGYGSVLFAPHPGGGLVHARASVRTPYGTSSIRWSLQDMRLKVDLHIPSGAEGWFVSPIGWNLDSERSRHMALTPEFRPRLGYRLASGYHALILSPRVES